MILLGHRMCCVLGCLRCFENRQACEASLRRLKTDYIASWKSQRMFAWVLAIVIACACIFLYLWFICCIWFSISLYLDGSATIATRCDKLPYQFVQTWSQTRTYIKSIGQIDMFQSLEEPCISLPMKGRLWRLRLVRIISDCSRIWGKQEKLSGNHNKVSQISHGRCMFAHSS